MMIEDVLDPEDFEEQGNQENIVRGIAALNHVKPSPQIDPPGEKELPKQGATELPYIALGAVPFLGHGVTIDTDPIETLVSFLVTFAFWAQYCYLVSALVQRAGLLPHARIERNGKVLNNNEDFSLQNWDRVTYSNWCSPARAHIIVACPQCSVGVLLTSHGEYRR